MAPLIDTNILFEYFTESSKFLDTKQLLVEDFYTNHYILCELLNLLQNKYNLHFSKSAQNLLLDKLKPRFVDVSSKIITEAQYLRNQLVTTPISFTDAIIIVQSTTYSIDVLTQDEIMIGLGAGRIKNPYL